MTTPPTALARLPRTAEGAVREAFIAWGTAFALLLTASLAYPPGAKLVATASFLYLPLWFARRRGEDSSDYGLLFGRWKEDVRLFLLFAGVIGPLFFLAFWGFVQWVPHLPPSQARLVTPLLGRPDYHFRLPLHFERWVIDQLLVVAVPEEFFYRGFVQTRLRDAWPEGRTFWGARLGRAFWVTAVMFALGHLAIFQAWRLAVFFPALLFGWMRERTGTVIGSSLLHAFCNLYEMVLETSFFG